VSSALPLPWARYVGGSQLVVLGLRDDWISFDEALDPRGFDPSLG